MSKTFDQGKDEVAKICRFFATNLQGFRAAGVKEAHIRQQLIDPFFVSLGWDVRNEAMIAPQYREVVPEDSLEIEGQQKAPDYTFRVGSQPKFFVEAKKCGVNINADPGPAFQLRRYGFSAKVSLSILTDFEELGVYDCSPRPKLGEKASFSRIQYFKAEEYPDRFREIWDIFSKEAVWSGAFDQYAASKRKRGTSEVDSEFLKEIEGWRDVLARNIALRNPGLSPEDLNSSVQVTIDRIIFLRMAEDRGIEPYEQLLKTCERTGIYAHFVRVLCRKADEKYNSGMFHFEKEAGQAEAPDRLTPCLNIDDKVIKPILQSLYFEHGSPYQFGVMPVEILGTVYERFLGKVIRLTEGHQAKIEEKPEVRKAGGVYYTPAYIVEYIVKNTVGKKIEGRSPAQLAGGKSDPPFRVLDMACGSGSFLLGAYQLLLNHCLTWYQDHRPETHQKSVYRDSRKGEWRLTIGEKKRILTTHIFGVDIDHQAVEVSKLSLLLKVLEGETEHTFGEQMQLFQTRALPNLSDNIKCGNSLIGPDYFSGKLIPDPDELKRVNAFDWNQGFPAAMKAGGFDCVIGNPPYVRQELLGRQKEYFQVHFRAFHGTADLYTYFIEKGVSLLRPDGIFSYIVANKWMRTNYGLPLRIWLKEQVLEEITDFGDLQVFVGATTYPCIIRIAKAGKITGNASSSIKTTLVHSLEFRDLNEYISTHSFPMKMSGLDDKGWSLATNSERKLQEKIRSVGMSLGKYLNGKIYYGIKTGLNEAFVIDKETRDYIVKKDKKSLEIIKPFLAGRDIKRYMPLKSDEFLIWIPKGWTDSKRKNIDPGKFLAKSYPAIAAHLELFKAKAQMRNDKGDYWWELRACDYYNAFEVPKIIYPNICIKPEFTIDYNSNYANQKCFIIPRDDKYLLGIMNSSLSKFLFHTMLPKLRGGFFEPGYVYLKGFSIREIDCRQGNYLKFVDAVKQMLFLHTQIIEGIPSVQRDLLQRQIDQIDSEIDQLVYELYDLTKEEIKIVEGETE